MRENLGFPAFAINQLLANVSSFWNILHSRQRQKTRLRAPLLSPVLDTLSFLIGSHVGPSHSTSPCGPAPPQRHVSSTNQSPIFAVLPVYLTRVLFSPHASYSTTSAFIYLTFLLSSLSSPNLFLFLCKSTFIFFPP